MKIKPKNKKKDKYERVIIFLDSLEFGGFLK